MSPLELIESADNNLYKAKENGRNQVVTDCMKIQRMDFYIHSLQTKKNT